MGISLVFNFELISFQSWSELDQNYVVDAGEEIRDLTEEEKKERENSWIFKNTDRVKEFIFEFLKKEISVLDKENRNLQHSVSRLTI